jgi:hypothetical protein
MAQNFNPTVVQEILGAIGIGANILLSPLTRPWYARWGSTPAEQRRALPGDDLVPSPRLVSTRAIGINAPASVVWLWLAQMGQGRGGLYSYQKLENLARCDMHNADRIHPEWQKLTIGDRVRFGPEGYPYHVVRAIDPGRALVLGSEPEAHGAMASWAFFLDPIDAGRIRLIVRYRGDYEPGVMNTLMWRVLTDPLFFMMERQMLIGIKRRAEALASPATAIA